MTVLSIILAYLIGAVPFGYLVARSRGVDIFKAGSGNIGATNVGRVLGRKYGLLVFVLDFLKGAIPTLLVRIYHGRPDEWVVLTGLAAIVGHMFPLYLRLRGGKGVATGFGVVLVLLPVATIGAAVAWATILATTRYMSLASVSSGFVLAGLRIVSVPAPFDPAERLLSIFAIFVTALVAVRHRTNLKKLWTGQENRLKDSETLRMLARILHIVALALWFGGGAFFSLLAAPSLFATFEGLADSRPSWLPLPSDMTKEQGTRLAGAAVGPIFPQYFALQAGCGAVAMTTALAFMRRDRLRRVHRVRVVVLSLALVGVVAGWPLVAKVTELRVGRYTDESLRAAFGMWHGISLLLNFAVLGLVGIATALAAALPHDGWQITDPHDSL